MALKEIFIFIACISVLCGFGGTIDIQCEYGTRTYTAVGDVYECLLQNSLNIKSRESAVINSVNGSHPSGKSNSDVTGFWSGDSSRVIEYFPRNLDNIFTNLKMIWIRYGRLKEIQQNDLRPFTKLVDLDLDENDIEFLEDGLFAHNPELQIVGFSFNKIIHIGSHVFDNLNKLTWLCLQYNTCINMYAVNNQALVRKVINQAKLNCSNSDFDNELKDLEQSLMCANSEVFHNMNEKLQNLQSRHQNSTFMRLPSTRERFAAFETISNTYNDSEYQELCLNDTKNTIEESIIEGHQNYTYYNYLKLIFTALGSVFCMINIILIINFMMTNLEDDESD